MNFMDVNFLLYLVTCKEVVSEGMRRRCEAAGLKGQGETINLTLGVCFLELLSLFTGHTRVFQRTCCKIQPLGKSLC